MGDKETNERDFTVEPIAGQVTGFDVDSVKVVWWRIGNECGTGAAWW